MCPSVLIVTLGSYARVSNWWAAGLVDWGLWTSLMVVFVGAFLFFTGIMGAAGSQLQSPNMLLVVFVVSATTTACADQSSVAFSVSSVKVQDGIRLVSRLLTVPALASQVPTGVLAFLCLVFGTVCLLLLSQVLRCV